MSSRMQRIREKDTASDPAMDAPGINDLTQACNYHSLGLLCWRPTLW